MPNAGITEAATTLPAMEATTTEVPAPLTGAVITTTQAATTGMAHTKGIKAKKTQEKM